jgi:hypothetical protein
MGMLAPPTDKGLPPTKERQVNLQTPVLSGVLQPAPEVFSWRHLKGYSEKVKQVRGSCLRPKACPRMLI